MVKVIKQNNSFLSSGSNKSFFVAKWQSNHSYVKNTEVHIALDESCIQLGHISFKDHLLCDHEDAD